MYIIRDREAGNVIDCAETWAAAVKLVKAYEDEDKRDGTYTPDFYEIVDTGMIDYDFYSDRPGFGFTLCGR